MTQRYGISRKNDSAINNNQLNRPSGKTPPKTADIDKFNATMRAKSQRQQQPSDNCTQGKHTDQHDLSTAGLMTTNTAAHIRYIQNSSVIEQQQLTPGASIQPHLPGATGNGTVSLTMALPANTTAAVQQAATIIQRIIQSHTDNKLPKTWRLQLTLDGSTSMTVQLEYHGKTDWSIGLLDEQHHQQSEPDHNQAFTAGFIHELQTLMQQKNPTLKVSAFTLAA